MTAPHFMGEKVLGIFKANEQEIVLAKMLKKHPSREAEVLLHEVVHAVNYNSNAFGVVPPNIRGDVEEHITDTISNGLILVLKDNPDLYKWMGERLYGTD